jgi:hypothetical protein
VSRRTEKSVVVKNTFLFKSVTKRLKHIKINTYLCSIMNPAKRSLTSKHVSLRCTEAHAVLHGGPWTSEPSSVSVHCFHKAAYNNSN